MSTVEELLSILDPIRLDRTLNAIESIAENITKLTDEAVGGALDIEAAAKKSGEAVEKAVDKAGKKGAAAMREFMTETERAMRAGEVRIHMWGKAHEIEMDKAERRWKQYGREVKRQMTQGRGKTGMAGSAMGLTGSRGIASTIGTKLRGIAAQLPMGGLLGLMIYGRVREEEWTAAGNRIARKFAAVGQVSTAVIGRMDARVRLLAEATGYEMEQELSAGAAAFAQWGVDADTAMSKSEISAGFLGDTVSDVALAYNFMTKSAAGTTEALIGQASAITGDFQKSANEIFRFGFQIRNTGANFQKVMTMMMQSLSGLRLQRQGVGDLTKNYIKLRESLANLEYGKSFDSLDKMQRARVSSLTGTGFQALAGGIGNAAAMDPGMASFLGRRISDRTGGARMGALETIGAFRQGATPGTEGGGAFGQIIFEMGKFIREGPGRDLAKRAAEGDQGARMGLHQLASMMPGVRSFEEGRALMELSQKMNDQIEGGASIEEAIRAGQEELQAAFGAQMREMSPFERLMRKIMVQLAKMGGALFRFLVSAIPDIISYLKILTRVGMMASLGGAAAEAFGVTDHKTAIAKEWKKITKRAAGNLIIQGKAFDAVTSGLSKIMKIVESPTATPTRVTLDEKLDRAVKKITHNKKGQQVLGALDTGVRVPGMDGKFELRFIPEPGGLGEPDIVIG